MLARRFEKTGCRKQPLSARRNLPLKVCISQSTLHIAQHCHLADVYGFFYHALPPGGVLSLEELHALIRDVWLTRHDHELEEERAARRKGRPKSTKELKLEETRLHESEEYRTGMGASHV